jgi:hypothetical protein
MTEKKPPEKRGDVQTEEAHKNAVRTEQRIREENPKRSRHAELDASETDEHSEKAGGEESKHGRKQKGNSEPV